MTKRKMISRHPVWDRFVRVFHWTLVLSVVFNYFLVDDGKVIHQAVGYLASALVLSRIVWGFVGSRHALFSDFFPTPGRVVRYVRQMKEGHRYTHLGHNPLGALMMLVLLALVVTMGITGWMQTLDTYWGEAWLQDTHRMVSNVLIGLASLHALAALSMGYLERTRLIRAMFTGIKERW